MADPQRRISMEEIKTHKWFTRGLPPGALEMNEFLLQGLSTMDDVSSSSQQPPLSHAVVLLEVMPVIRATSV